MKTIIKFIKSDWYIILVGIIAGIVFYYANHAWKIQGDYKPITYLVGNIFYALIIFIPAIAFQMHIIKKY